MALLVHLSAQGRKSVADKLGMSGKEWESGCSRKIMLHPPRMCTEYVHPVALLLIITLGKGGVAFSQPYKSMRVLLLIATRPPSPANQLQVAIPSSKKLSSLVVIMAQ
jgi:hypothetical protein